MEEWFSTKWANESTKKTSYLENRVVRESCKRRAACSWLATKSCHLTSQQLMLFKVSNCDYSTVGLIWKTHINIWHFTPIIAIIYWVFITKSWSKCFLGNQYQEINHKKQMPLCASGLPASHITRSNFSSKYQLCSFAWLLVAGTHCANSFFRSP